MTFISNSSLIYRSQAVGAGASEREEKSCMCARTLNLIQIKKRQVVGMGPVLGVPTRARLAA